MSPYHAGVTKQQYRLVLIGLGALFVAVVAVAIAINPDTGPVVLPAPIEDLDPGPNEFILRQGVLSIDLEIGYDMELFVNDQLIPPTEIQEIVGTGIRRWAPQEAGIVQEWAPGDYQIRITWNSIAGLPDPGTYAWTFRVQ